MELLWLQFGTLHVFPDLSDAPRLPGVSTGLRSIQSHPFLKAGGALTKQEFEEVLEALRALLDALAKAGLDVSEVPVLAEVIEDGRQEQAKRILDSW